MCTRKTGSGVTEQQTSKEHTLAGKVEQGGAHRPVHLDDTQGVELERQTSEQHTLRGGGERTVPKRQSGKERNIQMSSTTTMEPKGTAAREWYAMAMVFSTDAMLKHSSGNRFAVSSMVGIHVLPALRA